jgi:hypothetical protein
MHMRYFGDSYDIVKQSLIRWLGPFGDWSVHPMLTESATSHQMEAFERFLGAEMICNEVLGPDTNREVYLSCVSGVGNLFLDPDTGLRMQALGPKKTEKYLFGRELIRIVAQRPKALTMVFDQSLARAKEPAALKNKLEELRASGVHCFAYMSHASFVLGGANEDIVRRAFSHVVTESRLPKDRFLFGSTAYL